MRALAVEGEGSESPRKDLRKWADFRRVYGFFFPAIIELVTDPADERFGALDPDLIRAMASGFTASYTEPGPDVAWFEQIRALAGKLGFALRQKDYKKNPEAFPAPSPTPPPSSACSSPPAGSPPSWPRSPVRWARPRFSPGDRPRLVSRS